LGGIKYHEESICCIDCSYIRFHTLLTRGLKVLLVTFMIKYIVGAKLCSIYRGTSFETM